MLALLFEEFLRQIYSTLNDLVETINKHAKNQDYAIKKRRIKQSKNDLVIKAFVMCNAHEKAKFTNYKHRATTLRRKKCSFKCNAKLKNKNKNKNNKEQ